MKPGFIGWFFLLLSFVGMVSSCRDTTNRQRTAVILLSCPENCQTKVSLSRLDTNTVVAVDSLMMKPGKTARFRFYIQEPGFYLITYLASNQKILVLHPGDSIRGQFSADGRAIFTGGAENTDYQQFARQLDTSRLKIDNQLLLLESARYTGNYAHELKLFDSAVSILSREVKEEAIRYLQQHPTALSQALVINAVLGQQAIFKGLTDSTWYFYTDSTLGAHFAENPHRLMHHHRVQHLRQLARAEVLAREQLKTGSLAPEIRLPDFSDDLRSWKNLKENPILLYFWAPTDALSRQSNLKLKQLVEHKDTPKFQVYAVAFDPLPDRWKAAVNLDKLWWINVIDTLGDQSPLRRQYRIERLPVMILLDKEGRILQRFISVDAFKEYLEKNSF